jgi:hypothetical protein
MDGVQNGTETDKDCGGGGCQKCADGLGCATGADCTSQVCDVGNTKKCQAPTCSDGVRNGGEIGVDCAGPCPACGFGTACVADADCATGYCVGFKCDAKTLATGQDNPYDIAVDSAYVYWSTFNNTMGTIAKVPIGGGNVTTLAIMQGGPTGIALDTSTIPTTVYWVNSKEGTVKKVSSSGGVITTLASGQLSPSRLAVTPTTVFWSNSGNSSIMKVPVGGGAATVVDNATPSPRGIVVSGLNVYWVGKATVSKQALAGGGTTQIYAGSIQAALDDIVSDGSNVYFTDQGSGMIFSTGVNGGVASALSSVSSVGGIALTGTTLYWTNNSTVEKMATTGGVKGTIAVGQSNAAFDAVDPTSVYWTNQSGGTIKKANK